mgnify:CR=1 FL=1
MSLFPITCAVKCLLGVAPDHPTQIRQLWGDYPAGPPNFFTRVNSYTPKIYVYQRSPANRLVYNHYAIKSINATGPVSVVYSYLPPGESPPDPNGETGYIIDGSGTLSISQSDYYPRWKDDDEYDFTTLSGNVNTPISGEVYTLVSNASTSPDLRVGQLRRPNGSPAGAWSFKAKVDNLQSRVVNRQTGNFEYYDYEQATFEYEQVGVAGVFAEYIPCCWNEGMVITGKVSFKSIPFTTDPRPEPNQGGYGFGGMFLNVDGDWTDAGEGDWTATLSGDLPNGPIATVDIPATEGTITIVSDFWVTDITGP